MNKINDAERQINTGLNAQTPKRMQQVQHKGVAFRKMNPLKKKPRYENHIIIIALCEILYESHCEYCFMSVKSARRNVHIQQLQTQKRRPKPCQVNAMQVGFFFLVPLDRNREGIVRQELVTLRGSKIQKIKKRKEKRSLFFEAGAAAESEVSKETKKNFKPPPSAMRDAAATFGVRQYDRGGGLVKWTQASRSCEYTFSVTGVSR